MLLDFLNVMLNDKMTIYCDNKSAIQSFKNKITTKMAKHIDLKYHVVKNDFDQKLINLEYVHSEFNQADILTKFTTTKRFLYMKKYLVQA